MIDEHNDGSFEPAREERALVPAKAPPTHSFAEEIERWFRDHFVGSELGGTTERYNAAHAAKEDLKNRLSQSQA